MKDIAEPEEAEDIEETKKSKPEITAEIKIGDRHGTIRLECAIEEDERARAEEELKKAALGSIDKQLGEPPAEPVEGLPAEQAGIVRDASVQAVSHVGSIGKEHEEDGKAALDVENGDAFAGGFGDK